MAKTTMNKGVTVEKGKPANIVFQQLILRNIDRSQKDISDWRLAHRMAEAVVNPTRRRLYELFEDVMLDGHLTGIFKKRRSAVVNKKLLVTRQGEKDETFDVLLASKKFRELRKKLMTLHSHGLLGIEFLPGPVFDFAEIDRRHIKPNLGLITIEAEGQEGFDYKTSSTLWVLENNEDPFGFLLKAAPYALFKKGNWADWAAYVEIFGQPVIITKYDGFDDQTRVLLTEAMQSAGSSLRIMLPKQADFEMKDGKASNGDGKLQDTFKTALNNELSILVLGNTETTGNDNGGSYAKGKVHADQQLEITKDDMADELNQLNDPFFLNALKAYGFNTDGIVFSYETEVDNDKLKADLEIDKMLDGLGVPLNHDYFYEKYHRPKPDNYEELMAEKKSAAPPANDPPPGDPLPADPKKDNVKAALKGLTFWEKMKAVFSEAP